jgi:hypothetical protein
MKTKLSGALGLALLAVSFMFGSAFACSQSTETTTSELQTVAPDKSATVSEPLDALLCTSEGEGACAGKAQLAEVDQSPSSVSAVIEPSETEALPPPAIHSVDAILVEITQSVTIAVPGDSVEDNEEPVHTGSIQEPAAVEPVTVDTEEPVIVNAESKALDEAN